MKKIIILTILFGIFYSCKKETSATKFDYNSKANEVLQQIILDNSCGCIMEIPKESMIEINIQEHPTRDIRKQLVEKLQIRDIQELDSLEKLTDGFILDATFIKLHKIKVIPGDSLRELTKNLNFCPRGILCFKKPIFNTEYKKVVVDYGYAFMCLSSPIGIYTFENGKWKNKDN